MASEHIYEIQNRDGEVVCTSPIQQLGYSADRMKQILADGYSYYIDGKPLRKLRELV